MSGFEFRYRLGGGAPTIESLPFKNRRTLEAGDMLTMDTGEVALAATGDEGFLGVALEATNATLAHGKLKVITDADAVYAVHNGHGRSTDDTVDLTGGTGGQGIGDGPNGDLSVVRESDDTQETLVRISAGKHAADAMTGGQLNAAIARAIVRIHREYVGRGPTKAQAFFRGNVVVVIMHDVMTRAEQSLVADGQNEAVITMRHGFEKAMRTELFDAVERLTGAKVEAFLNDNHVDPDVAVEVFLLDRPVPV
jgi:uncharacterized protein YbcI